MSQLKLYRYLIFVFIVGCFGFRNSNAETNKVFGENEIGIQGLISDANKLLNQNPYKLLQLLGEYKIEEQSHKSKEELLLVKGSAFLEICNCTDAIESFLEALKINKKTNDERNRAFLLAQLSSAYLNLSLLDYSNYFVNEAEKIATSLKDENLLAFVMLKKGQIILQQENCNNAALLFDEAIFKARKTADNYVATLGLLQLGECEVFNGKFEKAYQYAKLAQVLANDSSYLVLKLKSFLLEAETLFELRKYEETKAILDSLQKYPVINYHKKLKRKLFWLNSQLWSYFKDYEKANFHKDEYIKIDDIITKANHRQLINVIQGLDAGDNIPEVSKLIESDSGEIGLNSSLLYVLFGVIVLVLLIVWFFWFNKNYDEQANNKILEENEKVLKEKDLFIRTLLDTIPVPIYYKNTEGVYVDCNQQFENLLAKNKSDIVGKTPYDFFPQELADELYNFDAKLIANHGIQTHESYVRYSDGKVRNIIYTKATFNDAAGNVAGLICVMTDISELKTKENELLKINTMKDKVFSIIAHDLRGPISNLRYTIEMIMKMPDPKNCKLMGKYLKLAFSTSNNVFTLLDNLLFWARNQQKQIEYSPEELILSEVVDENISLMYLSMKNKAISFETEVPVHLSVYADFNLISTVIRNLLSNAIKFTPKEGEIKITAEKRLKEVIISIEDSGIGISKENIGKILDSGQYFTTFGTNKEKGSGLGLKICKDFVERNGGRMWIQSTEGKGSSFFFTVPAQKTFFE